jgi:large subunit ribosomal protein L9
MAKRVQVVLNEDIKSLGNDGDLVEVAPGFARNFLLPNKKALPVTPTVLKQVEYRRAKQAEKEAAKKQEAIDFQTALLYFAYYVFGLFSTCSKST